MTTEVTNNRAQMLDSLLNEARAEADALRKQLGRYERIIESTRMLMGHELKKPTTALSGYLELVCDDIERAEMSSTLKWAEKARRECRVLDDLMSFYLELLQIGKDEPVTGAILVDVAHVISEAISDLPARLHAGSRVHVWVEENVRPIACSADALRLIIGNLIENALAYSSLSTPVRIEVERAVDQRGMSGRRLLKIRVIDEGVGVAPNEIQRIFRPFVRLHDNKSEGTGLGLTLVRSLVEMAGGSVHMKSAKGRGSTVHVTLPALDDSGDDSVVML